MGLLDITHLAKKNNASIKIELIKEGHCFIGVDLGAKGQYYAAQSGHLLNYRNTPNAYNALKKILGEVTYPNVLFDDNLQT